MKGYHYLPLTKKANRGFTLIEMAVVMVIIGIIISTVTSVLPSLVRTAKTKQAQATLEKVDFALQGYSIANHRLPFADSDGDGRENKEDSICIGNLPYLTLGLSSAEDPWRNSIKYAVYVDLASTTSSTFCTTLAGIVTYDDPNKIHITDQDTGEIINQAYIIVSGGAKDLDNDQADSFFDGYNEGNDLQLDDPARIEFHGSPDSNRYDDLMRVLSLTKLYPMNCAGSGSSAGGTSEICDNAIDDDGDGDVDCVDSDCVDDPACPGAGELVISTSTIPSRPINSDYSSVTFQAAGGTTPYEWYLTSNGEFTDFSLNTYTGYLSGTLDQCPGTYNISVQVEDSTLIADNGPKTASKVFSLQVTTDLSISRTSGPGTDITWNSPDQKETFKAYGGHLGDIEWQLNTGGATGFTVSSEGSDTCTIKKNGVTTPGTYTFTLTATDTTCTSNTAQINLNVTVTSAGGGSPMNSISEWHFDENSGTTAIDSQDGNHGTISGASWTTGVSGSALDFDGSSSHIEINDNNNLDITQEITIEAWVRPDAVGDGWQEIVSKRGAGDTANYDLRFSKDSGLLQFYWTNPNNSDNQWQVYSTDNTYANGAWHHVVATKSGTALPKLYVDGILQAGSCTYSATECGCECAMIADSNKVYIGSGVDPSNDPAWFFNGKIDEVAIYNLVLTHEEIQTRYNESKPALAPISQWHFDENSGSTAYDSADDNNGTIQGATWTAGINSSAMSFDGNNDYVNVTDNPSLRITGPLTIEAWVNFDSLGLSSNYNGLVAKWDYNNGGWGYGLFKAASTNKLAFYLASEPTTDYALVVSNNVPSLHTWYHVVGTYDGNTMRMYVNGVQQTDTDTISGINPSSSPLTIGAFETHNSFWFDGIIDEVSVYDSVLTAGEVQVRYNESKPQN